MYLSLSKFSFVIALIGISFAVVYPGNIQADPNPPLSAAPKDDGQWSMPAKNYASTRYTDLQQINRNNVADLDVTFTFDTGIKKGQEAAPIIVNDTLYIVTPYPNKVFGPLNIIDKVLIPQEALDALSDVLLVSITDLAISGSNDIRFTAMYRVSY